MSTTVTRRKDIGRPGNGGKYDHAPGERSTAALDAMPGVFNASVPLPRREDEHGSGISAGERGALRALLVATEGLGFEERATAMERLFSQMLTNRDTNEDRETAPDPGRDDLPGAWGHGAPLSTLAQIEARMIGRRFKQTSISSGRLDPGSSLDIKVSEVDERGIGVIYPNGNEGGPSMRLNSPGHQFDTRVYVDGSGRIYLCRADDGEPYLAYSPLD